jgi:hypothetical protein
MKPKIALILMLLPLPLMAQAKPAVHANTLYANIALTGSYRCGNPNARGHSGTLEVRVLPNGKVQFQLNSVNVINLTNGGVNMGESDGTLRLHNGTGVYYAEKPSSGRLLFHFTPKRVTITQIDDMDYGQGVDATGTYKKISRRPAFTSTSL